MDNNIIENIRKGVIDINNQELFFLALVKGLMLSLNSEISIRGIKVPHIIMHMGSDALYLSHKDQDMSIEPFEVSNENYIYSITPRCNISLGGIELLPDQLTSPYARGMFQYDSGDSIYNLSGEFRRMPIKIGVDLNYFTDSYRDLLELIQQIITKLTFIKTYHISYMGQSIICSYKIPEAFSGEHLTELDGSTTDERAHKLPLSLEVETHIPVFSLPTIISGDKYISDYAHTLSNESDIIGFRGSQTTININNNETE